MRMSNNDMSRSTKKTERDMEKVQKFDKGVLGATKTMTAFPGSTILPPNESLRRMMQAADKSLIIHIVLNWIHDARQTVKMDRLPPQLARQGLPVQGERTGEQREVDGHEEFRARTLEELELLWCENITDAQWGRLRIIERILDVDWPHGLTYAMTASFAFEPLRSNPLGRDWTALHLDYGDDEETKALMGRKGKGAARHRLYEVVTPQQLKDRFSAELKQFCSHSILLDEPVKRLPIRSQMYAAIAPLPVDWTQAFTHLRVVSGMTPSDICSKGLHVLHIPHSPWFLISGRLGGFMADAREMALTALAHSLGARRMRHPNRSDSHALSHGKMSELKGCDAMALRAIILSENNVQDRGSTAGRIAGGKGRAMRCGDAEDGPLIRAEKRRRDDASGLYKDVTLRELGEHADTPREDQQLSIRHPAEKRWLMKSRRSERRKRTREAHEVFGEENNKKGMKIGSEKDGLPRLEHIEYVMTLPFPKVLGYGKISHSVMAQNVVRLRIDGTHVLSGLKKLINAGLDMIDDSHPKVHDDISAEHLDMSSWQSGVPSWLTEARGTKVEVGTKVDVDEDESTSEVDEGEGNELEDKDL